MDPQQYAYAGGAPVPQQQQQQLPPGQLYSPPHAPVPASAMQQGSFQQLPMPVQPQGSFSTPMVQLQGSFTAQKMNGEFTFAQPGMMQQPMVAQPAVPTNGSKADGVALAALPPVLRDVLDKYDTNHDGILDHNEMLNARQDMAKMRQIVESGRVPMSSFPETARHMLEEHDKNGDGELDVVEIIHGFEALNREKRRKHQLMWFSTGLIIFSILLLVAVGGLMAYVIRLTKETEVDGSVMYVKGTTDPIQTSASEFTVKNGMVVNRAADQCSDGETCESPLKVSQAVQQGLLSSRLPDSDLQELKQMRIANGDSWIQFEVLAVARYAEETSRYGTVVVIYTHIGELTLDGDLMSFHEALEGAFSRAGFEVVESRGSRRRLMGVVETIGMFNFLSTILDADSENQNITSEYVVSSDSFTATVQQIVFCAGGSFCNTPRGVRANWVDQVTDTLSWNEEQDYWKLEDGRRLARTVTTTAQYPGGALHQYYNGTHTFEYVLFKNKRFNCFLGEDKSLARAAAAPATEGGMVSGMQSDDAPDSSDYQVEDKGIVELDSKSVRHFVISDSSGKSISYYVDPEENRLYQLQWSHRAWRFSDLQFYPGDRKLEGTDPSFDFDFEVSQCPDAQSLVAPPPFFVNRILDTYEGVELDIAGNQQPFEESIWEAGLEDPPLNIPLSSEEFEAYMKVVEDTQCNITNTDMAVMDGQLNVNYKRWDNCEPSARRSGGGSSTYTFSFTPPSNEASQCLTLAKSVALHRTATSAAYASGAFEVKIRPQNCFTSSNGLSSTEVAVLGVAAQQNAYFATDFNINFAQGGSTTIPFWEQFSSCSPNSKYKRIQLGKLETQMFNFSHSFNNIQYQGTNSAGATIYQLLVNVKVSVLMATIDKCGLCQNSETFTTRIRTSWSAFGSLQPTAQRFSGACA